ncbi:MAG TPA: HAD hydrolase-like protein, partial [Holophagaceae bacterium]|nr:HAD hydrolase-like protein [Holophagaceae bacterium]
LCFDLDGTLGHFRPGYLLLRQALAELWGGEPTMEELRACAGSTDWEIVDELHRSRFGQGLEDEAYGDFERRCLARFEATFHPEGQLPVGYAGILEGLHRLVDHGHRVWLVSGNAPALLDFKARALGIDARVPRLGSRPRHSRADLIKLALDGCTGPHLYVGDRPHDLLAAQEAGVPFLGIGEAVPGEHPILSAEAGAEHLVAAVEALISPLH